jgi:hypothetical protein
VSIKLVLIEFNEVNISILKQYLNDEAYVNRWPNLRHMVSLKMVTTVSEANYELLEPWIQWASVHNGLSADEHRIFRLGDINKSPHPQIFEVLENAGLRVGCISAMNAENRMRHPAYFIPDPWTKTKTDGSFTSESVYQALYQAVNDNAAGTLTKKTIISLIMALVLHAKVRNWSLYLKLLVKVIKRRRWNKALFLDLFISDLHQSLSAKYRPDFTTVFFNGFAHLQHHYFFSSKHYRGSHGNPSWYIKENEDPFPEALDVYDVIIGQHFHTFGNAEVLIATGLQQVAYEKNSFYYRLRNHDEFFGLIGIAGVKIRPRMTRDFLVECDDFQHAEDVKSKLSEITLNGVQLFEEIDNRGDSLFVTLTYSKEISATDQLCVPGIKPFKVLEHCVFVAIKNGMHDHNGYVFSTKPRESFGCLEGKHVRSLFDYLQSIAN